MPVFYATAVEWNVGRAVRGDARQALQNAPTRPREHVFSHERQGQPLSQIVYAPKVLGELLPPPLGIEPGVEIEDTYMK